MKILFIIDDLGSGGAQKQLVSTVIGLSKVGHNVDVYLYNFKNKFFEKELIKEKINIIKNIKRKKGFSPKVVSNLREKLKFNRYQVAVSFLNSSCMYLLVSSIGLPIKLIFAERSSYLNFQIELFAILQRQLYRFANHIVCNSETQKNWLIDKVKIKKEKVSVIYNGYNLDKVNKKITKKKNFTYKLIAIGRIHSEKNIIVLLNALIDFYKRNFWIPDILWVGRIDDPKYFKLCSSIIQKNSFLNKSWKWYGERKNLISLISKTDALIHPASYDGLSNVVCESIILGHPVLAGDVCDNKYLIGRNKRGLLFKSVDSKNISKAIDSFYKSDHKQILKMRENSIQYASKSLNLTIAIKKYDHIFNLLAK